MGPISAKRAAIIGGAAVAIGGLAYLLTRKAKAAVYTCPYPYCSATFSTYEELVKHVRLVHPGERIPIEITWE